MQYFMSVYLFFCISIPIVAIRSATRCEYNLVIVNSTNIFYPRLNTVGYLEWSQKYCCLRACCCWYYWHSFAFNFNHNISLNGLINCIAQGYLHRKSYIATQGPLPDTSDDFWRMIWEHGCATIVMLTKLQENGRTRCHRYWPETGAGSFGHYQVIRHNETTFPDYILRELRIVDTRVRIKLLV